MSATTTHDTKRSEDARARLNALSERPGLWREHFQRWTAFNLEKKLRVRSLPAPDAREEWLLYQTLLGAWPLDADDLPEFKDRIKGYVVKAARESKTHTRWLEPDAEYEAALQAFVDSILSETDGNRFLADFLDLQGRVAFWGFLNSLSQTVLKLTAPGVPDLYRGTEIWDFSLVDPDNRRPVDFEHRKRLLAILHQQGTPGNDTLQSLMANWRDGLIKLFVTSRVLAFRRSTGALFRGGRYLQLQSGGEKQENVCAFARQSGNNWAIAAVPRLVSNLAHRDTPPIGADVWTESFIRLPREAPDAWVNVLTGERLRVIGRPRRLRLAEVFQRLPVAVLRAAA